MPHPGEPLWLPEDTAAVMALVEEEANECPKCGMPKDWCRDHKSGRARFDVVDDYCWATDRIARRQKKQNDEKVDAITRAATLLSVKFREGHEPDVGAGLELGLDESTES